MKKYRLFNYVKDNQNLLTVFSIFAALVVFFSSNMVKTDKTADLLDSAAFLSLILMIVVGLELLFKDSKELADPLFTAFILGVGTLLLQIIQYVSYIYTSRFANLVDVSLFFLTLFGIVFFLKKKKIKRIKDIYVILDNKFILYVYFIVFSLALIYIRSQFPAYTPTLSMSSFVLSIMKGIFVFLIFASWLLYLESICRIANFKRKSDPIYKKQDL